MDLPSFECPVCLDLIVEPISLPCGHNFCVKCKTNFSKTRSHKCPVCRRVFPNKKYQINSLLEYLSERIHNHPEEIRSRNERKMENAIKKAKNYRWLKLENLGKVLGLAMIVAAIGLLLKFKGRNLRKWPIVTYHLCSKLLAWTFASALDDLSSIWSFVLTYFVTISFISSF